MGRWSGCYVARTWRDPKPPRSPAISDNGCVIASITDSILHLHGWVALLLVFALPALEASAFVGFVFPGEIAVLLGGVLAYQGRISLAGAIAVAIAGAIIGDSVGYEVGKHYGTRLLDGPFRRIVKTDHREKATAFLRRHGGKA